MKLKKTICIVSSSRADYNYLYLLMKKMDSHKTIDFKLVVTGMHLLPKYGNTYKQIIQEGFKISAMIDNKQKDVSNCEILSSMSNQLIQLHKIFTKLKPDIIVILGDRYDIFPIAIFAHVTQIPLAHIAGGELTYGAIDDGFRHCISKLSMLHFVAHKDFKTRLKNMGEHPSTIFNIGSLGLDAIKKIKNKDIRKLFNIPSDVKYFLVCVHPETINKNNKILIKNILKSLDSFKDYFIVFSQTNSDPSSDIINNEIKLYNKANKEKSIIIKSPGRENFINLLRNASCMIGNSSSGIVEAPFVGTPSVNIGRRQEGRPLASSIVQSKVSSINITDSIKITQKTTFKKRKKILEYKSLNSTNRVVDILLNIDTKKIKPKRFYE